MAKPAQPSVYRDNVYCHVAITKQSLQSNTHTKIFKLTTLDIMHTAIVFYEQNQLTPMQAFDLLHTLAQIAGIPIKSAGARYINKSGEPTTRSMKVDKLALALAEGEASDFLLYPDSARVQIATGYFDFKTGKFGTEPSLLFIFEDKQSSLTLIRQLIDTTLAISVFAYGIRLPPS